MQQQHPSPWVILKTITCLCFGFDHVQLLALPGVDIKGNFANYRVNHGINPERERGEALGGSIPGLSVPVPFREVQVCCFTLQQTFWVDGKYTRACRFTGELRGFYFFCITFVLATVGGSWSSNAFFLWSRRGREVIIDPATEWAPCCVQNLLVAPRAM